MNSNNFTFPLNGDEYIGTESCCIDLQNDIYVDHCTDTSKTNNSALKSISQKKEKREFPPPIPLLARTQNPPSHMPWVLRRYYTSDGRLILKEEKVEYHRYFRAHRANGRLILQLVPLDDHVLLGASEVEAAHEESDGSKCLNCNRVR